MGNSVSNAVGKLRRKGKTAKVTEQIQECTRFERDIHALMQAKCAYKTTSPEITTAYFHCIREMHQTAMGIVFLFHEAEKSVQENQKSKLDTQLDSLLNRTSCLRQEIMYLLQKSVYHVDLFVEERKESAEEIYLMLEEVDEAILKSFQAIFYMNAVKRIVKKIHHATEALTRCH